MFPKRPERTKIKLKSFNELKTIYKPRMAEELKNVKSNEKEGAAVELHFKHVSLVFHMAKYPGSIE